jgi:hypothetical protein
MNCERMDALLNDYVDGSLSASERSEVERHLDECAACRLENERLRALLAAAADLPREETPPRDLWPEVRDGLDRSREVRVTTIARPFRSGWMTWAGLAAAAALLVVTTVWVAVTVVDGPDPGIPVVAEGPGAKRVPPPQNALAAFRAAETSYTETIDDLALVFEQNRDRLAPETVAVVEKNLTIIDEAIGEIRAAFESDPINARLGYLLASMYRQKMELLRRPAQLSL